MSLIAAYSCYAEWVSQILIAKFSVSKLQQLKLTEWLSPNTLDDFSVYRVRVNFLFSIRGLTWEHPVLQICDCWLKFQLFCSNYEFHAHGEYFNAKSFHSIWRITVWFDFTFKMFKPTEQQNTHIKHNHAVLFNWCLFDKYNFHKDHGERLKPLGWKLSQILQAV